MSKHILKTVMVAGWLGAFSLLCYAPLVNTKNNESKHLSILTWGDILEPEVIHEFETTWGVKVHLSYYGSNEELLVKMKATEGDGYDILIPSDYAVAKLIENDLVMPIDRSQIQHFSKIDPLLLNQFYDPGNKYSLPLEWEVFGFGYNKELLDMSKPSWNALFNPDFDYKYVMSNDPNEAIQFASFYLFGPKLSLNRYELEIVTDLLSIARKRTEAYATFRSDYFLATKSVPLVVASSSYIWRSMKYFPFIGFKIPEEGSFITIENIALSKKAKNIPLAHKFIDYILSDSSMEKHFETYSFFPSTIHQLTHVNLDKEAQEIIATRAELFKKLQFIHELSTQEQIQDTWVKIKVSSLP